MSVSPPTIRALYRRLYRTAKNFDRDPFSKVFLHRTIAYELRDHSDLYYDHVIRRIFQDRTFISKQVQITLPFVKILQNEFRNNSIKDRPLTAMIDAGFALFRNFQSIWSSWIDYEEKRRARLNVVKGLEENINFQEMATPEPGMILISHPLSNHGRSVYLLLQKLKHFYYALELTNSTDLSLKSSTKNLPEQLQQFFGKEIVRLGGPHERLQVIHRIPELGRVKIPFCNEPFYSSMDLSKLMDYMKQRQEIEKEIQNDDEKNERLAKDFMFFVGCRYLNIESVDKGLNEGKFILGQVHPDQLFKIMMNKEVSIKIAKETAAAQLKVTQKLISSEVPSEGNTESKGSSEEEVKVVQVNHEELLLRDLEYANVLNEMHEGDEYLYSSVLRAMGESYEALLAVLPEESRYPVPSCSW